MRRRYPLPPQVIIPLVADLLRQKRRDFRQDARLCVSKLRPPLEVAGEGNIPLQGPYLLTVNHYSSPTFHAGWVALATSALIPDPVHWVITAAWTSPNPFYTCIITPLSRWLFRRVAQVYGFTNMPPMPPRPGEEAERAKAVLQVLSAAHKFPAVIIGLAPEGRDSPGGVLACPPPGAGRFMVQLAKIGFSILPAGIFESDGTLCLRFGPVYLLPAVRGLNPEALDRLAAGQVMRKIASLLPEHLQGVYRENLLEERII